MSDRREPDEKINNELSYDVGYDWGITHTIMIIYYVQNIYLYDSTVNIYNIKLYNILNSLKDNYVNCQSIEFEVVKLLKPQI